MFKVAQSVLVVVDVQGKLAYLMHEKERLFRNILATIKAAYILDIPVLWTEQAPEKIGATVPEVADLLTGLTPIPKTSFSCCGEKRFLDILKDLKRKQVILVGIETHVCVYQTAADLVERGYEVQVVADAVSSRNPDNNMWGLERIKQSGAGLTCCEALACELLQKAEGDKFKMILNLIK